MGQVCGYGGEIGPSQHPLATLRLTPHPVSPLARAGWTWRRGPRSSRMPTGHPYKVPPGPKHPPDPTQHIPPTMQNDRRPPPRPSASEPSVGSLAPLCGPVWQAQESTDSSRVGCRAGALAVRRAWAERGPLAGPSRGDLGGSACTLPAPLLHPTSCMVSGVRVAVARASASKVVLNSLSLSG